VARHLARSLAPAETADAPPSWLLPGQVRRFRRALAAIERYGGALLADPVGSGKTYVALAVALALARARPTACLVPAALADQWRSVAARVGVPVDVGTHEQASRSRLPTVARGIVLVDESHHFRNPKTRRYQYVAPWLLGRPVLLLSATPIVNRLEDLAHQLLLGVRDDALIAEGVGSIRGAAVTGVRLAALGRVVLEDTAEVGPRPRRSTRVSMATVEEAEGAATALDRLSQLRLSRHPATAALVRGVLYRALASSPAALAGAVRRYRQLLLHARDAQRAGRRLARAELRAFTGEAGEQLVLWELVADGDAEGELELDDLGLLDGLRALAADGAAPDSKADRLRALVADGRPTLVFVTHRETVRYLRECLGPPSVAWCTGDRAGLGHAPAPRATVLKWFRDDGIEAGPRCLVVTEVAAEGLDLRRAARVVHYDLPWTPMRLEQREGRAVRLGSGRAEVEVVRFEPPDVLDAALQLTAVLARKAGLPARVGLGAAGLREWRWRSALADRAGEGDAAAGMAVVALARGEPPGPGLLGGFELHVTRCGRNERLAAAVGWVDPAGRWSEDELSVTTAVMAALRSEAVVELDRARAAAALDRFVEPIRTRLSIVGGRRWIGAEPDPAARRLAVRIGSGVREAARQRDGLLLARLERALAFVAGGHTAGEALLVRRMAVAELGALARGLTRFPLPTARWDTIEVRVTGLVLFETESRLTTPG
jgi:hypothetical protein